MSSPFQVYPRTRQEFAKLFPNFDSKAEIAALAISPKSGSNWTKRHLRALRVLRIPVGRNGILENLESGMDKARWQLEDAKGGAIVRELIQYSTEQVISRPSQDIRTQCQYLSSYYIKLATLLEPSDPLTIHAPRPSRATGIRSPQKAGFVTGASLGFSSSPTESSVHDFSSSPYAPSANDAVDRSDYEDRIKPEELTTALAHEFLGAICDLTRPVTPESNTQPRLEVYPAPTSYHIPLFKATSIDDGSLVWKGFHAGKWRCLKPTSYCGIEGKRVFTRWEEFEDREEGTATDQEFAQIVSQVVGSVCQRMEQTESLSEVEKHVFLISAYQTSHRFIHAYFSDDYLSFLSGKTTDQSDLDGVFLRVFESRRYDHRKPNDRVEEAVQLLAMINWLEEHICQDDSNLQY